VALAGACAVAALCVVAVSMRSGAAPSLLLQGGQYGRGMVPSMGELEQQLQQQKADSNLMEEGTINVDASSDNPAADFFAAGEDAGDDEDVPDAGKGGVLPGWTKPELLKKPDPAELESFQAPSGNGPVFNSVDYDRNPGAISAVNSARDSISRIRDSIKEAHAAAEKAKARFEEEKEAAAVEEDKYRKQVQQEAMMRARMAAAQRRGLVAGHNWGVGSDTVQRSQGAKMWGAPTAQQQQQQQQQQQGVKDQGNNVMIDPDSTDDAAAEYRKAMYKGKEGDEAKLLADMARVRRDQERVQHDATRAPAAARKAPAEMQLRAVPARRGGEGGEAREARAERERGVLDRDEARAAIARQRYAAARRRSSPFHAAQWTEGCPEGTPGCSTRSAVGYLEQPKSGIHWDLPGMRTAGDQLVPAAEARRQEPRLWH